jgi:5-dehydro-2-deoxygluconokinase
MAQDAKTLDLIAVGRSSVDLYGQQIGGRLEDMGSFANMGRFIREQLEREGVDVAGVLSDPDRLTALVILGIRDRVNFPLIFYRENCADMALEAADIDEAWFASAGAVLINGTHLSQPNVYEASLKAVRAVKAAGGRVAFDIDYRPVLWGLTGKDAGENRFVENQEVTRKLQEVVALCDLIVGTEEEIHILGGTTDTIAALRAIRLGAPEALLVCKRGADGCVAFPGAIPDSLDDGVSARGFKVEVFNVLGAGDAFMAGFLRGWLRGEAIETCCEWGNACGAIVVSRHGCAPAMPTWVELQSFLSERERPFRLREDVDLEHIHWATTRTEVYEDLTVLAIDHRSQFEDLIAETGGDAERIPDFKRLALRAVQAVAGKDQSRFGLLLDGRFGFEALAEAADHDFWIARPIELPKSRPLEFESSADVATELAEWPLDHVVKCLAFYHPDDEAALRERQERQLLRLADACRKTRHELLLELILPQGMESDSRTVARAIRRIYALGIRPDWWKLEPLTDPVAWREIQSAIADNDPLCRGVVLLGLSAPEAELIASFEVVAPFPIVKGFAVGRTIFYDVAREWLSGRIDDTAAVSALVGKFKVLVDAWRRLRGAVEKAA